MAQHQPHDQPGATAAAAAAAGLCAAAPLPADVWQQLIVARLDPWSQRQLRLACRALRCLVPAPEASVRPLCSLRAADTGDSSSDSSTYLAITPPQRRVALGCLDARRRCEQRLCVFVDNAPPAALDVSAALPAVSAAALASLVDSAPRMRLLALPPCLAAPSTVLKLLAALPLRACDLDCSLAAREGQAQASGGWRGLASLRELRALQLRHVPAASLPGVLEAFSCLKQLASLSLGVRGAPQLHSLPSALTRLELR